MTSATKPCPVCQSELEQALQRGLSTWQCANGHGVGVLLGDAYRHLQRDELEQIWSRVPTSSPSSLRSPLTGAPMVEVTFSVDQDTDTHTSAFAPSMTIEVDPETYFGWFSLDELQAMPQDESGRAAARPGLVGLDQLDEAVGAQASVFDEITSGDVAEADDDRPSTFDRLANRVVDRLRH